MAVRGQLTNWKTAEREHTTGALGEATVVLEETLALEESLALGKTLACWRRHTGGAMAA
jgi:hypothetical protein